MTINGEIIHKGERYGYGADCGNEYQNMYVGSVWDSDGDWLILGKPRLVNELPSGLVSSGDLSISDCLATKEARGMRLKGYGNAIVVSQAELFIRAFM